MFLTNDFCYLEMMRSGSTHIHKMFQKFVPEGRQIGHHGPADTNILKSKRKFVGSIRSPWTWYLSVWSFGCENGGHLHHRLTEKKIYFDQLGFRLKPYLFPYVFFQQFFKPLQQWRMLFSDSDNYDKEFGIDYDGRVTLEHFDFTNAQELVEQVVDKVLNLFQEEDAPEDDVQTNNE